METKQLNLKISKNLLLAAESYALQYGYKNVQELIADSMREKVFEKNELDIGFSKEEVNLIETLIEKSLEHNEFISEDELRKNLLG